MEPIPLTAAERHVLLVLVTEAWFRIQADESVPDTQVVLGTILRKLEQQPQLQASTVAALSEGAESAVSEHLIPDIVAELRREQAVRFDVV